MGRGDGGAIAVVVAVFAVVAFGFGAIVVDFGYARSMKARAQDAADSAALAAATALYSSGSAKFDDAEVAAERNARYGFGLADPEWDAEWLALWASCRDPSPLSVPVPPSPAPSCVSFDVGEGDDPRQVRVRVPDTPVDSFFGIIFGSRRINVSASAVASLGPVEFTPECAICVLGPGPHVLSDAGVVAQAADIFFNGAVDVVNSSTVAAPGRTLFVRENVDVDLFSTVDAAIVSPTNSIDVPLDSELPLPPGDPKTGNPCDPLTGGPGTYIGDVVLGSCPLLEAGPYSFTGAVTAAADAEIVGVGVQLQLQAGASIDLSEAAVVNLTGPSSGSLIYANDEAPVTIDVFGGGIVDIRGDINAPSGTLVGGPGSLDPLSCPQSTINGLLVVGELDVDGRCIRSSKPTVRTIAPPAAPVLIR